MLRLVIFMVSLSGTSALSVSGLLGLCFTVIRPSLMPTKFGLLSSYWVLKLVMLHCHRLMLLRLILWYRHYALSSLVFLIVFICTLYDFIINIFTTQRIVVLWSHNTTIPTQNPMTQPIVVSWGFVLYCRCVVVFNSQHNKLLCHQKWKPIRNGSWLYLCYHGNSVASTKASTSIANWVHVLATQQFVALRVVSDNTTNCCVVS